ncbi:MAG: DUF2799 domain-containing protein [Desulfobacterales bacterium]|nr:DUF2799 domain-containing protein [Desulfobacterales bacterium]
MTKRRRRLAGVLVALGLALCLQGCATLSEEECLSADWHTIGYEDGSRGFSAQRIGKHREACAEHGITPNFRAYMDGHRAGLRQYCIPVTGFALGRSGKRYSGICPEELEYAFLAAFEDGRVVYRLQQEIEQLRRDIRQARNEKAQLEKEIEANEAMIIADATPPSLRRELMVQNRKLEDLIEDKQLLIEQSEEDIDWLGRRIEKESRAYATH